MPPRGDPSLIAPIRLIEKTSWKKQTRKTKFQRRAGLTTSASPSVALRASTATLRTDDTAPDPALAFVKLSAESLRLSSQPTPMHRGHQRESNSKSNSAQILSCGRKLDRLRARPEIASHSQVIHSATINDCITCVRWEAVEIRFPRC